MTCIVGLAQHGNVYLGGDSAGISGYDVTIRRDPKVFTVGPYLIGYTSSFRMGQLLRYRLHVDDQDPRHDDFHHMATVFIDTVRQVFKDGGFAKIDSSVDSGGIFLVGYRGRLYQIADDFQVGESVDDYAAVGCGESYALGSLYMTECVKSPTARVLSALETAQKFSVGVRGPFVVVSDFGEPRKEAS